MVLNTVNKKTVFHLFPIQKRYYFKSLYNKQNKVNTKQQFFRLNINYFFNNINLLIKDKVKKT